MNDEVKDDFQIWMEGQPDNYVTYSEARSFLSSLLGSNKAKAEVEMMKLQKEGLLKVIKTYKTSTKGKRVFRCPLPNLSESHFRAVFDGSSRMDFSIDDMAKNVHDRTGHDTEDIIDYLYTMEDEGKVEVFHETFNWVDDDEPY